MTTDTDYPGSLADKEPTENPWFVGFSAQDHGRVATEAEVREVCRMLGWEPINDEGSGCWNINIDSDTIAELRTFGWWDDAKILTNGIKVLITIDI